jgi:glycosyltransferase involved in cell wall biosynthesis
MNASQITELKRLLKLPFKLVYYFICLVFFMFGLLFLYIPICKKNSKKHKSEEVTVVSHVAISFDGRIKKSANTLIRLGKNVTLLKPMDSLEDEKFEKEGLDSGVSIKKIGLSGVFNHFPCMFDIGMLFYMIFSKARYLHCHDVNTALMGSIAAKITGKIIIADLHEWKAECSSLDATKMSFIQTKTFMLAEKLVLKHADFVISVNDIIANEMMNFYKVNRKVYIVKNIPTFQKLKPYNLRKKLGINPNFLIAYYVGQLAPYRRIDQLIKAAALCDRVVLVIQGTIQDEYLKSLKKLSVNVGVADKIFFLPPVSHHDIPSFCQGADIGVFTCETNAKSMYFSLPNKLFEYILGEIPIISEDVPAVRSYIEEFDIGTLITSKDVKTIVNAFNSYFNSDKLKSQKSNIVSLKKQLKENIDNGKIYRSIYQRGCVKQ